MLGPRNELEDRHHQIFMSFSQWGYLESISLICFWLVKKNETLKVYLVQEPLGMKQKAVCINLFILLTQILVNYWYPTTTHYELKSRKMLNLFINEFHIFFTKASIDQ